MGSAPDQKTLGYYLGHAHFLRDRGAGYVDSARTSIQAGFIAAGVLLGAGFLDRYWAGAIGIGLTIGLEAAKILLGWMDSKLGAIKVQQQAIGWDHNPVESRKIELLEEIAKRLGEQR